MRGEGNIAIWEDWDEGLNPFDQRKCDSIYNGDAEQAKITFPLDLPQGEHEQKVEFEQSKRKVTGETEYIYAGDDACRIDEANYCKKDCTGKKFSDYFYKVFIDGAEKYSRSEPLKVTQK